MTRNRVVSGERAAEIIRECRTEDNHFVCHKGSHADLIVHCRSMADRYPSRALRFARQFDIPIREVDPDALA